MSGRRILRRFSSSISDLLNIQKKCDQSEDERGTPLHEAVRMGNTVMTKSLLDNKSVWVDEEDQVGRTALHYAVQQSNTDLTEMLILGGANVDCVDYNGTSACHIACKEGMLESLNTLIKYDSDTRAIDKSGKTPFDIACEMGNERIIERLLETCEDWALLRRAGELHTASSLHLAARNGHIHIVLLLLECGWDIDSTTSAGTALHEAAGNGKAQVVRFLLHAGINGNTVNSSGHTALEYAKKNAQRNPITIKEIRQLLKDHNSFIYVEAIRDHKAERANELSFVRGDIIWVTERGTVGDSSGARWKGIIFGQKANSRNGFFHPSAVKQVGKPAQVYTLMPAPRNGVSQTLSRQAKRVELPVVPHMEMISNKHENDYNHNSRPSPIRSKSSTSSTSEETNSRYGAINGNKRVSPMSTFSGGSFNSYGTDTAQLLGAKYLGMASLSPTTSGTLLADSPRISTGSISSQSSSGFESSKSNGMASASSSSSSFLCSSSFNAANQDPTQCRSSVHSLGSGGSGDSSLASSSMDALDDSFYSISSSTELSSRVTQMVAKRVPEAEILAIWLDKIGMTEYLSMFLTQGYDLASIARITPEDLITLGITNPQHRRKLIADIHSWQITDSWPSVFPIGGVSEWLTALAMPEYTSVFEEQGYDSLQEVIKLGWEDFEDIGIKRLGHLKRLMLAAKKLKDHERLQGQQSTGRLSSAVPVASPMLSARVIEHNNSSNRHGDPPPPAPLESSWMTPPLTGGIDYVSYTRGGMKMHNKAAPNPPMRSQSNISSMCSSNNSKRRAKSSYDSLFDQIEPIRLNLVSTGKILSEAVPEKELPPLTSGSSFYSIDYPPPPAPLNCEGSIRRLQKAFHSSTSSSESTSSLEQLPFANDNCGTIRSRDTLSNATSRLPLSSMSRSNQSSTVKMDRYAESKTPTANSNVLSDIGSMLQNLTDELDAMLTTKLSANVDPSSEHCIR